MVKKILSSILALSMLSTTAAVLAEEANDIMLISAEATAYDKAELYGTASFEDGYLYIVTENGEVMLNTDENTLLVDGDGYRLSAEAIADGASLKVIADQAMTMSIPPQSYAHVIMTANEAGGFPIYAEVENVITDENGNLAFASKDGIYNIICSKDLTQVLPFATRNIVTADDIKAGSRILVFADIMTMSLPAMVPANKIVLLPETAVHDPKIANVTVNGTEVDFIEKDGIIMLPVRSICEANGLEVKWDGTLNAVTVGTVQMGVTFNIGVNSYTFAKMMPQTLSSEPIAIDGTTFVPAEFFTQLLGGTAASENGTFSISF